jgi:cytochrome c-type biogenesis protein CcmH/NrfG
MLTEMGWLLVGVLGTLAILILAWPASQSLLVALAGASGRRAGVGIAGMIVAAVLAATLSHRGPSADVAAINTGAVLGSGAAGADLLASASRMSGAPVTAGTAAPGAMPVKPAAKSMNVPPMEVSTAKLAARLEKNGGSKADWKLLGQSYDFLGKKDEAAKAYAKADAQPK